VADDRAALLNRRIVTSIRLTRPAFPCPTAGVRTASHPGVRRLRALRPLLLLLSAALLSSVAATPPARAQDHERRLQRMERELDRIRGRDRELDRQAQAHAKELDALRRRLVEAAAGLEAAETALAGTEADLHRLTAREAAGTQALADRRAQLIELLAALQRVGRIPPEAALLRPGTPIDAARAAMLLQSAVPGLRERAEALRAELEALAATRAELAARRDDAERRRAAVAAQRAELTALLARREELARRTDAERERLAERQRLLAAQASDLRALMERIEAERQAAEERRQQALREEAERQRRARSGEQTARAPAPAVPPLTPPVAGSVALRFGEADRHGAISRGMVYETRGAARVVAPAAGSVVFAGPFKGYGLILIVEHAGGYHSLLSGLGRIDVAVGQRILAGEPVGAMDGNDRSGSEGLPRLYFELRRGGQPVDPRRGLPSNEAKGQG